MEWEEKGVQALCEESEAAGGGLQSTSGGYKLGAVGVKIPLGGGRRHYGASGSASYLGSGGRKWGGRGTLKRGWG